MPDYMREGSMQAEVGVLSVISLVHRIAEFLESVLYFKGKMWFLNLDNLTP